MYQYGTTDFENASMVLAFYSIELKQLVAANKSIQRESKENLKPYTDKMRTVKPLSTLYTTRQLSARSQWPKQPFYTVPFTLSAMLADRDCYCPTHYRQSYTPDRHKPADKKHAPGFPIAPVKHQAMFQFWLNSHNRYRRKAIVDNEYAGARVGIRNKFFDDEAQRAYYLYALRTDADRHQAEIEHYEKYKQTAGYKKGIARSTIPTVRKRAWEELSKWERIFTSQVDKPTNPNSLVLLVNVKRYYDKGISLLKYKLDPADVLPTVHNAMSFYLIHANVQFNTIMNELLELAENNDLDAQNRQDDFNARVCCFQHYPINCIDSDEILFTDPVKAYKRANKSRLPYQPMLDKYVAVNNKAKPMQKKLWKQTKPDLQYWMPTFKPKWLKQHLYTGNK